jgi:hypothetical protein
MKKITVTILWVLFLGIIIIRAQVRRTPPAPLPPPIAAHTSPVVVDYTPGNVFNDAAILSDSKSDTAIFKKIVRYYYQIDDSLPINPYLTGLPNFSVRTNEIISRNSWTWQAATNQSSTRVTSGIESILSPVKIADGLGTFIADRFKEELTMKYIQTFRDSLTSKDAIYHYSQLLPKTFISLKTYDNIFDYKQFITALKEAFKDDLDHLASNSIPFAETIVNTLPSSIHFNRQQFYFFLAIADYSINKIPNGESPLNIFSKSLYSTRNLNSLPPNVKAALEIAGIICENLRNSNNIIIEQNLNTLVSNPDHINAFLGLLICKESAKLSRINIDRVTAYNYFKGTSTVTVINDFIEIIKAIKKIQIEIEGYKITDKKMSDLVKVINATSLSAKKVLIRLDKTDSTLVESAYQLVGISTNIMEYADEQKYGLMITELLKLLDSLKVSKGNPIYDNIHKYGPFIANVAQAKSATEVKEALESAALPVGSYKIKRSSFFDISFNAYAGLFVGGEHYLSQLADGVDQNAINYGFTAPVGLAFSWGHRKEGKADRETSITTFKRDKKDYHLTGKSSSIFVSIIDVGAITAFRLTNDKTKSLPEFTWNNILAPGIYYIKGWKDSPLTWGLGIQSGPQLREIKNNTAVLDGSNISARLFVAVDIPIFSFFTRTTPKVCK